MDKMKSGNIYEIADVVRNLSFKQKEKGLSTGEKKMLYNAKQILVSELVFAENSTQNEVEELIDSKINSSYAMALFHSSNFCTFFAPSPKCTLFYKFFKF